MTRYLKQTAEVTRCVRDQSGQPTLDAYGRPQLEAPRTLRCRKEKCTDRGLTPQGQVVKFMSTYYFDEQVEIQEGDIVDGHEVQQVEKYVLGSGAVVGYEVTV